MRNFKRGLAALFVLMLVVLSLFFVLENQQSVTLVMFGWSAPALPSSIIVLLALVVGLVIGPLLGVYGSLKRLRRGKPSAA
ncbi:MULTISPECIES: lipopolysaccharide assembly protein LapA domain-containing protein [Pseudomonas]|uniref:DUF1049 domain-containing protein n=1 Tax=Pseudomonas putida TaxID=303 RepID=A0AAD0PCX7_PSEPU|nr:MULTISPECIES: lipopolysaccharide assembly protein LapA domain-containing protein [Pseudomonas]AXA26194.1 DUF1049 domain-containing protein [Pseudomonas putida]HEK0906004.1 DUF1049 domain-containing protein [Pseudomonas putida]HEK1769796.1 DUF1049 domain-containing protein [Pseudomonas putida]